MARHLPGTFCWFELGTTNPASAKAFYGTLFGWSAYDMPMGPDAEPYTIFRLGGEDVAAAYALTRAQSGQGIQAHWLPYVAVEDADACMSRTRELGGAILQAGLDVAEQGRLAVLQDPTGAVIAVWQGGTHKGIGVSAIPGTAAWVELSSPDQNAAAKFYTDLFGWEIVTGASTNPNSPGDYLHIQHNGRMVGGILPTAARDAKAPPSWLVYFQVKDCETSTAKAVSLGAFPYVDNMEIGEDGRISVLGDPQRAVFALHQAK